MVLEPALASDRDARGMEADPILTETEIHRLCVSLVAAEQDLLCREGRLERARHIHSVLRRGDRAAVRGLVIDEETLGFDSLSIAALTTRVATFFGLPATGTEDHLYLDRSLSAWAAAIRRHMVVLGSGTRLTFETSGSTGHPKRIAHELLDLAEEVGAIEASALARVSERRRVVCCVPVRHIYGCIWGALVPRLLGLDCVDIAGSPPARLGGVLRPGDLVIATPHVWEHAGLDDAGLPEGIVGVTSGAPATPVTWDILRRAGLEAVIEVYGSTETGGIGWRVEPDEDLALFPHIARAGDAALIRRTAARPFEPPDILEWSSPTRFRPKGRRDGMVQIAGVNVSPEAVRAHLCAHDGVRDAAVRPADGRLKAFVVPEDEWSDTDRLRAALRVHVMRGLAPSSRPDRFTFGAALPMNDLGKRSDW